MGTGNKTGGRGQRAGIRKDKKTNARAGIFYITENGLMLAHKIKMLYPDAEVLKFRQDRFTVRWRTSRKIICIMAAGIVVRTIAPLLQDKRTDPAVIVLDEKGRYAISLLSGHLGGANKLARDIADFLGGHAVITTASDVQGRISLDIWADEHGLYVEDGKRLTHLSARMVNGKSVTVYTGNSIVMREVPGELSIVTSSDKADIIISEELFRRKALYLRPINLFVGIGCNRGTTKDEIQKEFTALLKKNRLSVHSIAGIASIDLKKDEGGLLVFAEDNRLRIRFFPADALNAVARELAMKGSEQVRAATGAVAVSEPAAVLAARQASDMVDIIIPKVKRGNVTLAIAKAKFMLSE